jgi:hypothetical protein
MLTTEHYLFFVHRVTTAAMTFYSTVQYSTVIVIVVDPTPAIDHTIRPFSLRRRQTKHTVSPGADDASLPHPPQKQKQEKGAGHSNNLPFIFLFFYSTTSQLISGFFSRSHHQSTEIM